MEVVGDDSGAIAPPPATADERMMSMDELKEEMFKSLRDTGTIEAIRAQLRRRFIDKLQNHGRRVTLERSGTGTDIEDTDNTGSKNPPSVQEQLVHGLIHDYLQRHHLEHSVAVFVPEIGGVQQLLPRAAVAKMLHLPQADDEGNQSFDVPLVTLLTQETARHATVHTMSSATQTVLDCQDHRLALEHELRRVETTYLAQCAQTKSDPQTKCFDERILQYQREYDALCEQRLREDMARFKTNEVALMRADERRQYDREMEAVKSTMRQEHRDRLQRLQDRERELELAFTSKKTELETSLWDERQRLFQEMEKLRVKQHEVDARANGDTRNFALETKRLELWEERLKHTEANIQSTVDGILGEKERAWQLERTRLQGEIHAREQSLAVREQRVEESMTKIKREQESFEAERSAMTRLEVELVDTRQSLVALQKKLQIVEAEKAAMAREMDARDEMTSQDKHNMKGISYENARLVAELTSAKSELSKLEDLVVEKTSQMKQLEGDVTDLHHQLLQLKLRETNAVVDERKRLLQVLEDERSDARWRENELVARVRELQNRLGESEAKADKYQTQYEDEKVHAEALRHEVASLHSLLAQSQSVISSGGAGGGGGNRSSGHGRSSASGGDGGGSEQMLMRIMQMMMNQMQAKPIERTEAVERAEMLMGESGGSRGPSTTVADDESTRMQEEVAKKEKELLEQREYERKKREREEAEKRELGERRRAFDEEMERERRARAEAEEQWEREHRQRLAEEQARLQAELDKQQRDAELASRELKNKLLEEQIAMEQKRLQEERLREEERAMRTREEEEERRRQQLVIEIQAKELEERRQRLAHEEANRRRCQEEEEREEQARVAERQRQQQLAEEAARQQRIQECQAAMVEAPQEATTKSSEEDSEPPAEPDHHHDDEMGPIVLETVEDEGIRSKEMQEDAGDAAKDDETEGYESDAKTSQHSENDDGSSRTNVPTRAAEDRPSGNEEEATTEEAAATTEDPPASRERTPEEIEAQLREVEEEAKKREAEAAMDVYRQRVLARRAAAEKQRQEELEAQRRREEEEAEARRRQQASDDELDASNESFASSAASSSDSF